MSNDFLIFIKKAKNYDDINEFINNLELVYNKKAVTSACKTASDIINTLKQQYEGKNIRTNAVYSIMFLSKCTNFNFFKDMNMVKKYANSLKNFFVSKYGKDNVIYTGVFYQLLQNKINNVQNICIINTLKDNRLNAKAVLGNPMEIGSLQHAHNAYLKDIFKDVISKEDNKDYPNKEFFQVNEYTGQIAELNMKIETLNGKIQQLEVTNRKLERDLDEQIKKSKDLGAWQHALKHLQHDLECNKINYNSNLYQVVKQEVNRIKKDRGY